MKDNILKKYFFIISGILIIILGVFTFMDIPNLVDATFSQIDEYGLFEGFNSITTNDSDSVAIEDINQMLENIDFKLFFSRVLYLMTSVVIIINIITIFIAKNNHILKHKIRMIIYTLIELVCCLNIFHILLVFLKLIIILSLKRKNEEDYPDKYKRVEPLEYNYYDKKSRIFGLLAVITYVLLHFLIPYLIDKFTTIDDSSSIYYIITFIIDVIAGIIIAYLFRDELKKAFCGLKENFKGYRVLIVVFFIVALIITVGLNMLRMILVNSTTSVNQAELYTTPLWYLAILAIIWAPLVEEIVFRGFLRRIIKNKYAFIIVSGLLFGFLHAINEDGLYNQLITMLPYSALGIAMALIYVKTNNIAANMGIHMLNNALGTIARFLLLGI